MDSETHYLPTAAAFVRGRIIQGESILLADELRDSPLDELTDDQLAEIVQVGSDAGLKLHKLVSKPDVPNVAEAHSVQVAVTATP